MSAVQQRSPVEPLQAEDGAERRAILAEADRLLDEGGEAAFSIRRLVERCGCSAPAIYRYFGDKGHLVGELLEARLATFADELRCIPEADDPVDDLIALGHLYADFGRASPACYRLFTLATDAGDIDPPSGETCRELLSSPIDRLVESGRVDASECAVLKQALWALVHGVVTLQVTRPGYGWDERLLDVGLRGLIAGTIDRPPHEDAGKPQTQLEDGV